MAVNGSRVLVRVDRVWAGLFSTSTLDLPAWLLNNALPFILSRSFIVALQAFDEPHVGACPLVSRSTCIVVR